MDIIVEPINKSHNRVHFDCGVGALNQFIKKYAFQNHRKDVNKTFVAIDEKFKDNTQKEILGFYTLTSGQINLDQLPKTLKHPKHPVSVARLARLAIQRNLQGQGFGGYLLYDALSKVKAASNLIGIYGVVVDAKDKRAQAFYENYGFVELQNPKLSLCLPIKTINKLFP